MFKDNRYRWIILAIGLTLVLLSLQTYTEENKQSIEDLKPVLETYELILNRYYNLEGMEKEELVQGAIEGMLDQLPDKYNAVYSKKEYREYRNRQEGNYVGIGMEIEQADVYVRVVSTFPDTPAARSGITSRDLIIAVNGKSTKDMTFQEVYDALKGKEGTKVELTVRHEDGKEELIEVMRTEINITPVEIRLVEEEKIALIDINLFNLQTSKELEKALGHLETRDLIGYIVDLRNNSGGWLNSAIDVASEFVDKGLITKTVGRIRDKEYDSRGNSNPNLPLVVLINDGTASASELVAGAIRDQQMGVLVGRNSFGKGLVQTTHTIARGYKVKLSTAEYITPAGKMLHNKGLTPDIKSERRGKDLDKAIKWIEEHKGQLMPFRDKNS